MSDYEDPFLEDPPSPAPVVSPNSEKRSRAKVGRDCRLGIIGFPNSGKTSWLYALLNGPTPHVKGQRPWGRRDHDPAFAALTNGQSGFEQQATSADKFTESRFCRMTRPWIGGPVSIDRLSTSQWIVIPEVGGEAVRQIALGRLDGATDGGGNGDAARSYMEFLDRSDAVLCLVAVDSNDLAEDIVQIRQVLPKVAERGDVIPVTVLLTKVDLIKRNEARDQVILPVDHSEVAAMARRPKCGELREFLDRGGSDENSVRFSVNALLGASFARGDLELHECVALDFLKHDNPIAAQRLESLAGTLGIDLRFFLSAPYGRDFKNADGTDLFPPVDQLRPIMVYEPLEDLLERSWRRRSRRRLRSRLFLAAAAAVALTLVGPGAAWWKERAFDEAMRLQQPPDQIRGALESMERWWWNAIELSQLEHARSTQAERWLAYRERLRELGREPLLDPEFDEAEERARDYNRDPEVIIFEGDGVWRRLLDVQSERDSKRLLRFIESGEPEPENGNSWDLSVADTRGLAASIDQLASQQRDAQANRSLESRIQKILASLEPGEGEIPLSIEGEHELLARALAKLKASASLGMDSAGLYSGPSTDEAMRRIELGLKADRPGEAVAASESILDSILVSLDARLEDPLEPGFEMVASETVLPIWLTSARDREVRRRFDQWWNGIPSRVEGKIRSGAEDQTRRLALAEAVGDLDRVRVQIQAMEDSGFPWVENGSGVLEDLSAIQQRQQVITDAFDAGVLDQDSLASVRRVYTSRSSFGESLPIMAKVGEEQRAVLQRVLEGRIAEAWLGNALDEVDIAMDCLDVVAGEADSVPESERGFLRLLRTIREEQRPDPTILQASLRGVLQDDPGLRDRGERLALAVIAAPALEPVLSSVISSLEDMPSEPRLRFLRRIVDGMGGDRWSEVSADMLIDWIDALAACDEPRVEHAQQVLESRLAIVERNESEADARDATRAIASVLLDLESKEPEVDVTREILGDRGVDKERRLFEESDDGEGLKARYLATPTVVLRRALLEKGVASPWLHSVEDDRNGHLALIQEWDLLPIGIGSERFWMARREWRQAEVQRIVAEYPDEWQAYLDDLRARNPRLDFNFDAEGRQKPGAGGVLPTGSFVFESSIDAASLVGIVGLRLPSLQEWEEAASPVIDGTVFSEAPDFDTNWEQLEQMGDRTPAGVVGLRWGVREWVADSERLQGFSNLNPTPQRAEAAHRGGDVTQYDEGVRPVLDGVPKSLKES